MNNSVLPKFELDRDRYEKFVSQSILEFKDDPKVLFDLLLLALKPAWICESALINDGYLWELWSTTRRSESIREEVDRFSMVLLRTLRNNIESTIRGRIQAEHTNNRNGMKRDQKFYDEKFKRAFRMVLAAAREESITSIAYREGISASRVRQLIQWGSRAASGRAKKDGIVASSTPTWWTLNEIRLNRELWELIESHCGGGK